MATYATPGVYHERSDTSGGGISALRTDIAGFVGIAQRGPVGIPVPVESTRQFEAWFGSEIDTGYLAYCARAFFENGGRRMWAVRVGSYATSTASLTIEDSAGNLAWSIEASSGGVWGNAISVRVTEVRRAQVRARVDELDLHILHTDNTAGFGRGSLVECLSPLVKEQATVEAIDPIKGRLILAEPLALISASSVIRAETVAYSVEVFEAGRLIALYEDLTTVPTHSRYGPAVLKQPWQSLPTLFPDGPPPRAPEADLALDFFRVARNRTATLPPPIVIRELRTEDIRAKHALLKGVDGPSPTLPRALTGGADGLGALCVQDFTGDVVGPGASIETLATARRGVSALEAVDEIALLSVPDIHIQPRVPATHLPPPICQPVRCLPNSPSYPATQAEPIGDQPSRFTIDQVYQVQASMVAQCERRRDRIALLDAPFDTCNRLTFAESELRAWRSRFDSKFATLYAPWVKVVDPLRVRGRSAGGLTRPIPPSGHVAGQYAATDLRIGVHAAPANNPINWAQDPTLAIDEARHGFLNSLGINVLRAQSGLGIRILGARTLSSDSDWRFVNVRRLFCMIEKAIDVSIQWAVFEPNNWLTHAKLSLVIRSFLRELWSRGAMVGAIENEAFYVRCDESNNPPDMRAQGRLLIEVGIAPSVPFEFIVLRIGRDANGFTLTTDEPTMAAA